MNNAFINRLRRPTNKVSQFPEYVRLSAIDDAFLLYNGAPEEYEDPADYIRLRGGRVA